MNKPVEDFEVILKLEYKTKRLKKLIIGIMLIIGIFQFSP